MAGPGLIKIFILMRPGPAYNFHGTLRELGGLYEIFGNFMEFSVILCNCLVILWNFGNFM